MAKKTPTRKSPKRSPKPPPKCKAMLLCERAIVERLSGNVSLINTFTAFVLRAFPGFANPFTAFLQLTGGTGRYDVTAELVDLRNDKTFARATGMQIEFKTRLDRINVMIPVPQVKLPHDGRYDFVVYANGQVIERQEFSAILMDAQQPPREEVENAEND